MNANLIKNSGLSDTEARVYEALLALGPSLVSDISRKAGISRTLGYHALEKLALNGLVNRVSGVKTRLRFSANHPRSLYQFVTNRANQWERRREAVENLLPELVANYKAGDKPTIKYLEGVPGVKEIYNETLEAQSEILSILDIEGWNTSELKTWGQEYNRERSRRKIHERILMLDTPPGRNWMKNYKGSFKFTEYRWIKKEQLPGLFDLGGEINIYDDKVVMAFLKKPHLMGVMITSQVLANLLKTLFELAWQVGVSVRKASK